MTIPKIVVFLDYIYHFGKKLTAPSMWYQYASECHLMSYYSSNDLHLRSFYIRFYNDKLSLHHMII